MLKSPTSREMRGMEISIAGNVKRVSDNLYKVRSQSGRGFYDVKMTGKGMNCICTCNCKDFARYGGRCKHILATLYFLRIENYPSAGSVTAKDRRTYKQVWSAYNAAQKAEFNLFSVLLRDLLSVFPEREQTMGRPRLPIHEVFFCAIQKVYSQLSSRRAYSLFQNAAEKGQIDHAPHFNSTSKLFNDPRTIPLLHTLVALSAYPVVGLENDFSIDSTGFRTTTFGAYCDTKYEQDKEHIFLKAHLCAGVKTNIIAGVRITDGNGSDCIQFGPLIKKTIDGGFTINEVSADMAYSSRDNLEIVSSAGGIAYIPFKKSATGTARGSALWKKMYHYFQAGRDEYMEHYHKRSNIEATNAAIKRKLGETLKSKNSIAQINELLAKIVAYNLTVVIHEMYENGIEPDFLKLEKHNSI
jgi:transposase